MDETKKKFHEKEGWMFVKVNFWGEGGERKEEYKKTQSHSF